MDRDLAALQSAKTVTIATLAPPVTVPGTVTGCGDGGVAAIRPECQGPHGIIDGMESVGDEVEVVVAHHERAAVRVGDVFLKIDGHAPNLDVEVKAMRLAPVPTPEILWRRPQVLALARVPGAPIARLGKPSVASPTAWTAAGAAVRALHDAPLPPWPGKSVDEFTDHLNSECEWLVANDAVPADVVRHSRNVGARALRPWTPVFTHGDLQVAHVFMRDDEVTGIIDWSEAAQGDGLYDLAILTLGHPEHLDDVLAGYGGDVDRDVIEAWWSIRGLLAVRWLVDHGFDPAPEIAVLEARL